MLEVAARGPRLCEAGVVRGRTRESLTARLAEIYRRRGRRDRVAQARRAWRSKQLYSHYKQPRTAILMGHARGVICLAAAQAGIPVAHYSATQIKKMLTGNGRAAKPQMQRAVSSASCGWQARPSRPTWPMRLAVALCHFYTAARAGPPIAHRRAS